MKNGLIVFQYHGLRGSVEQLHPRWSARHVVELAAFRAQLDLIVDKGFNTIRVADLDTAAAGGCKEVILTFDDGYASDFICAAPELRSRNLQASFFPSWSYLDHPGYLSREQLLELDAQGFEIGSHGLTHRNLSQIAPSDLCCEATESKHRLEDLLSKPIVSFAVPFGRYNDFVLQVIRAAGYRRILTSDIGMANRSGRVLRRIGIVADTTSRDMENYLAASPISLIRARLLARIRAKTRFLFHSHKWG